MSFLSQGTDCQMGYSPFINTPRISTKSTKPARSSKTTILVPQPCVHCAGIVSNGGPQIFPNIGNHLQILRVRRVTRSNCPTDGSKLWTDQWISLPFNVCCLVHAETQLRRKGENGSVCDANNRRPRSKYSRLVHQVPGICAFLVRLRQRHRPLLREIRVFR